MARKNNRGLVLVGGRLSATEAVVHGGPERSGAGLAVRFLRALGWAPRAAAPERAPGIETGARCEPALPCEMHFANELEAAEYAREMTARGYSAEVQYDIYDYSWSVEVRGAPPPATAASAEP